ASRSMTLVIKLLTPPASRLCQLQLSAARQSLHAGLLVHTQHRLPTRSLHVKSHDRPHLLPEAWVRTMAPVPDAIGLQLRALKDPLTRPVVINTSRRLSCVHVLRSTPRTRGAWQAVAITSCR